MVGERGSSDSGSLTDRVMNIPSSVLKELSTSHIIKVDICDVDILKQRETFVKGRQGEEFSLPLPTQLVAHHVGRRNQEQVRHRSRPNWVTMS